MKRIEEGRGVLMARLITIGHVPQEISKICHYFILLLSMVNDENHPYLRVSGGLEIKLNLTFNGRGDLIDTL